MFIVISSLVVERKKSDLRKFKYSKVILREILRKFNVSKIKEKYANIKEENVAFEM